MLEVPKGSKEIAPFAKPIWGFIEPEGSRVQIIWAEVLLPKVTVFISVGSTEIILPETSIYAPSMGVGNGRGEGTGQFVPSFKQIFVPPIVVLKWSEQGEREHSVGSVPAAHGPEFTFFTVTPSRTADPTMRHSPKSQSLPVEYVPPNSTRKGMDVVTGGVSPPGNGNSVSLATIVGKRKGVRKRPATPHNATPPQRALRALIFFNVQNPLFP
jgi:hypothetical protein